MPLYDAIESASCKDSLVAAFYRVSSEFGFKSATLMKLPSRTDKSVLDLVLESELSRDFFAQCDSLGDISKCPLYEAARGTILPSYWALDQLAEHQARLSQSVSPILQLYLDTGIHASTLLPLTSLDGSRHIARFDGVAPKLSRRSLNDLVALTMRFFDSYDRRRFPMTSNPCGLTERELEALRWTAMGKTTSEISQIVGLSEHTVNAYLNNAIRKLDCTNRTQLVAKALRMHLIS
jgi:DNA-binding CsgD family transcriptional regulator